MNGSWLAGHQSFDLCLGPESFDQETSAEGPWKLEPSGSDFPRFVAGPYAGDVVRTEFPPDCVGAVAVDPADELLRLPLTPGDPDMIESSFLGFNVPERDLNCLIRHWLNPSLGLASGGVILVRGEVENAAFADYIDYEGFMPMKRDSVNNGVYPSGVQVRVVEPLKRVEMTYAAPNGRLRFEVVHEALMPAAGKPSGGCFTQAMRTCGLLVLDGERIEIDGYSTRERRWSVALPEDNGRTAPMAWASAIFGPDLALHFSARDGERLEREKLNWGYVWRDGETRPLEAIWMRTHRGDDGAAPKGVEVRLLDAGGETYEMAGETRARAPLNVWPNVLDQMCLMQYRLNGRHCYGDFQDLQFNSFLRSTRPEIPH